MKQSKKIVQINSPLFALKQLYIYSYCTNTKYFPFFKYRLTDYN